MICRAQRLIMAVRAALVAERALAVADRQAADRAESIEQGFINPGAARAAVRRLKLRHMLHEIGQLSTALLDSLDQASEPLSGTCAIDIQRRVELRQRDIASGVGHDAVHISERDDMREKELLEGADLVLQFLNSLLKALSHGQFSTNHSDAVNASAAGAASHRLSEGRPHT